MELLDNIARQLASYVTGMESRLALIYLCSTVLLVYAIWVYRGRPGSFLAFMLPRKVYTHPSNLVDIKIFAANLLFGGLGLFSIIAFAPWVTERTLVTLAATFGAPATGASTWMDTVVATVVIVLTLDFCKYWAHYIHHENRFLWHFHALHHSAEVLTPLTANRNHPVFLLIRQVVYSVLVGFAQAFMLFLLVGQIDILTIGSANAAYVLFNFFGANLRHSHVWLSYGPVLEHVFISPAQHQIHHSIDKKHHNKNYGELFAFWDWMFGTLYVPRGREELTFGVSDAEGNPIPQPHPTLRAALIGPFIDVWHELLKGTSMDPDRPSGEPAVREAGAR